MCDPSPKQARWPVIRPCNVLETVCLDQFLNLDELRQSHRYLCYAIAKSRAYVTENVFGELRSSGLPSIGQVKAKLQTDPSVTSLGLNEWELPVFAKLLEPCTPIVSVIPIVNPSRPDGAHDNSPHFDVFKEWLLRQRLFKSLRRLNLTLGHYTPAHSHKESNQIDHGIWMRVVPYKRFYLLDPATNVKHYPAGHAFWWNFTHWHGVDPLPFESYAFAASGEFTQEVLDHIAMTQGA